MKTRIGFGHDESGGGTVFGLYIFIVLAAVSGLALDATNGWRNRTFLAAAVDMGVHAGSVAMANGQTNAQVKAEVARVIEANLPQTLWGNVFDANTDIEFAQYDPYTNTFSAFNTGNDNAIIVEVERSTARGNPVGTYLMNFVGVDRMHVSASSAALFDVSGRCTETDGIFAHEQVTITSQADVGSGICIHSQDYVWLPQNNTFQPGSVVSMPDLDDCQNKCTDSANPGINPYEVNMVLPDINSYITATYNAFTGPVGLSGTKYEFFTDDPLDPTDAVVVLGNQAQLLSVTGAATPYALGDVVSLSHSEFHSLNTLPSGLVYEVNCNGNGNGPSTRLTFDNTTGQMEDAVLLTNCRLDFDTGSSIIGSVVITTRINNASVINASTNVTIGDPTGNCVAEDRSLVMAMSGISVPSKFAVSNVTLVVDGDVNFASTGNSTTISNGFAIYTSGEVHIASKHTMRSCGQGTNPIGPQGKVARLVIPTALP